MAVAVAPRRTPSPPIRDAELCIDGPWLPARSGRTCATIDPATGFGRELGEQGLEAYLEHKTVTVSLA